MDSTKLTFDVEKNRFGMPTEIVTSMEWDPNRNILVVEGQDPFRALDNSSLGAATGVKIRGEIQKAGQKDGKRILRAEATFEHYGDFAVLLAAWKEKDILPEKQIETARATFANAVTR